MPELPQRPSSRRPPPVEETKSEDALTSPLPPPRPSGRLAQSGVSSGTFPPEVEQARADPARRLGRFVILSELGRGGMGAVHRAYDEKLRRVVALKTITEGAGEGAAERFRREAEAVARLKHPSIVSVHDLGETDGKLWLSMELVPGRTLKRCLAPGKGEPKLPLTKALEVVRDVARAVNHAHEQGVLHRDLKPENVMVDEAGRAYVLDFGLALLAGEETGSRLTRTGTALGTPAYMSPEQASGEDEVDARSDVYSLGATLYFVLAGKPPFQGASEIAVLAAVLRKDPEPPSTANARCSGDLETICLKCLEKTPARRYRTARELADDLDRYLAGDPIAARPIGGLERLVRKAKRNKLAAALVLVVVASVLALGLGAVYLANESALARSAAVEKARDEARTKLGELEAATKAPRPTSEGEERKREEDLLAKGLAAFAAGQRLPDLAPGGEGVSEQADAAATALGEVALEAKQWSVARVAFGSLRAENKKKAGLARVEEARTALERARRSEVQGIFEMARSGKLAREGSGSLEDAVSKLASYKEPLTVDLLAKELGGLAEKRRSGKLTDGEKDLVKLACRTLALLSDRRAVPPLIACLEGESDQLLAVEPALALCKLREAGGVEAERAVLAARERLGVAGPFWSQISPLVSRLAAPVLASETAHGYYDRGVAREAQGDPDGALADFTRAIELDPRFAQAYAHRGLVRELRKDQRDLAIADYAKAIELDPGYASAYKNLGCAKAYKGDLEGAIRDLTRAIELDPKDSQAWSNRGELRRYRGDLEGAIEDDSRALEIAPRNPNSWVCRGLVYDARGMRDRAIADFSQALEIDPRYADAWKARGVSRSFSDLDGALSDLDRAVELAPGDDGAWGNRGNVRLRKGDMDGAIADCTRALELAPRSAESYGTRGHAKARKGDREGAISDYDRSLELAPDGPLAPSVRDGLARLRGNR